MKEATAQAAPVQRNRNAIIVAAVAIVAIVAVMLAMTTKSDAKTTNVRPAANRTVEANLPESVVEVGGENRPAARVTDNASDPNTPDVPATVGAASIGSSRDAIVSVQPAPSSTTTSNPTVSIQPEPPTATEPSVSVQPGPGSGTPIHREPSFTAQPWPTDKDLTPIEHQDTKVKVEVIETPDCGSPDPNVVCHHDTAKSIGAGKPCRADRDDSNGFGSTHPCVK